MVEPVREKIERLPGERTCDWLGRFSGKLAEAAMTARERGDEVHAAFFAVKAAETLALAKALGFAARPSKDEVEP